MKEIKIKHPIFSAYYHGPGETVYFDAEGNLNVEGLDLLVKGPTQYGPKFMDADQIEIKVNYEEDGVEHAFSWLVPPLFATDILFRECQLYCDEYKFVEYSKETDEFVAVVVFAGAKLGYTITATGERIGKYADNSDLLIWDPYDGEQFLYFKGEMNRLIHKLDHHRGICDALLSEIAKYRY